jgi:hypothetical protein
MVILHSKNMLAYLPMVVDKKVLAMDLNKDSETLLITRWVYQNRVRDLKKLHQ